MTCSFCKSENFMIFAHPNGELPEWSIGADSKSVVPFGVPGVRIPHSPLTTKESRRADGILLFFPVQPVLKKIVKHLLIEVELNVENVVESHGRGIDFAADGAMITFEGKSH